MTSYQVDAYRRTLDVRVVRSGQDDRGLFVVLDDTVLYPEGGGQPADRGTLAGIAIEAVLRSGGEIRHYLPAGTRAEALPESGTLEVDWARRYDHMQQHTAQHLLTAVAREGFGRETTAFHLGQATSDIEVTGTVPDAAELIALEEAAAMEVRGARAVTAHWVTEDAYAGLDVRGRALPEGHAGDVRIVDIQGIDRTTCGGTHVASTSEIESLVIVGAEPMRGGTRLHWLAGGRVRERLRTLERRGAELRSILGAADDELADAAGRRIEQLKESHGQIRLLEQRWSEALADAILGRPGPLIDVEVDGPLAVAQAIARRLAPDLGRRVGFLTGEDPKGPFFVVVAGASAPIDLAVQGPAVAGALGGRGGGSGSMFQGRATKPGSRDAGLAILRAALEPGPQGG